MYSAHAKCIAVLTYFRYSDPKDLNLKGAVGEQIEWYDDLLEKLRASLSATGGASDTTSSSVPAPAPTTTAPPTSVKENSKPPTTGTATTASSGPSYPTSSKTGPKNWDKLALEDGEDGKDGLGADGGGDVDSFFRQIFEKGDPETRRAMQKSFIESNGTSLSTSWEEAKDKTYTPVPPDGTTPKPW